MISINKNSKIYIFVPAYTATGGPEALHQLCKGLRDIGLDAYMYYIPTDNKSPVHPEYEHYSVPFLNTIDDDKKNMIIIPEPYNYFMMLNNFKNIQKVIWWLSIDNFYISHYFETKKIQSVIFRAINKLSKSFIKRPLIDLPNLALKSKFNWNIIIDQKINLHLAQSNYAKRHLESKGLKNIEPLFEYIKDSELFVLDNSTKENIVLFNPTKGSIFTKKIITQATDIKFIPIEKMNHSGVIELMKRSKVYIDFGNHPGRDRMPREAALCGCCIITGKRGSAMFFEDVPIPNQYKFSEDQYSTTKIIESIRDCLDNYKNKTFDFNAYRDIIKNEQSLFMEQLKYIFKTND